MHAAVAHEELDQLQDSGSIAALLRIKQRVETGSVDGHDIGNGGVRLDVPEDRQVPLAAADCSAVTPKAGWSGRKYDTIHPVRRGCREPSSMTDQLLVALAVGRPVRVDVRSHASSAW